MSQDLALNETTVTVENVYTKKARHDEPKKEREHYDEIKRENVLFTDYYTRQELVPEEEWSELVELLGQNLPLTFRLTGHRAEAAALRRDLQEKLLPALGKAARKIPWYRPAGHAFHLETDRKAMRTTPDLAPFHKWLVNATENGDISRQEAVSMVPPLFLDVQADQLVLDMCAAPGSKTAQLVEYMHADAGKKGVAPSGLVIANDSDQQRAYMLYHQVKRILSPSLLVSNNDGTTFPTLIQRQGREYERVYFDRILADVPCSGDGTLRKNANLWKTWTPNLALGLHPLQIRLLEKAVRLLKVGGKLVYSTCSMNFIENEAVIAWVLNKYRHALELVDVSKECPELVRRPGRTSWRVISREGQEFDSFDQVPPALQKRFPPSVFPHAEYARLGLERAIRIYPHLQNTGGFFVAVIAKKADLTIAAEVESGVAGVAPDAPKKIIAPFRKRNPRWGVSAKAEDEFRYLKTEDDPVLANIFDWYGIDKEAMVSAGYGFLVRSERSPIKIISIVAPRARPIFEATVVPYRKIEADGNDDAEQSDHEGRFNRSLKVVNTGVRAFEIYESSRPIPAGCPYRPLAESVTVIRPFMTKRTSQVTVEVIIKLLQSQDSVSMPDLQDSLGQGGAILESSSLEGNPVMIPVWISERGVKAFVPNVNRPAILCQLGA